MSSVFYSACTYKKTTIYVPVANILIIHCFMQISFVFIHITYN